MKTIRVLVAPDSFKSTLSASAVAHHLAVGLRSSRRVKIIPVECPIADGGEGTLDALARMGATTHRQIVTGPLGAPVDASWSDLNGTAYVEVSQGAGAHHVDLRDPDSCLRATSEGVGQLLLAALDAGHSRIVLTTGGSAATDGGVGMLFALGLRTTPIEAATAGGRMLRDIRAIDLSRIDPRLQHVDVVLAADVTNPLLGRTGSARTFAPQKGAGSREVEMLEAGLAHWTALVAPGRQFVASQPGAGASGGIGFAALAALGAIPTSGADLVLDLLEIDDLLDEVDLVITGEGSVDKQSLSGKAPLTLARRAAQHNVPVLVVAGRVELTAANLRQHGVSMSWSLEDLAGSSSEAMNSPERWLERAGRLVAQYAYELLE